VPLRKKYEGRGKKRCGPARTDEASKWDEGRLEDEGNGDLHCRGFGQNQTGRSLKISQAIGAKKSKLSQSMFSLFKKNNEGKKKNLLSEQLASLRST
jgi:hypothetical protein